MKVKELIVALSKLEDKDEEVYMSSDPEGNGYWEMGKMLRLTTCEIDRPGNDIVLVMFPKDGRRY